MHTFPLHPVRQPGTGQFMPPLSLGDSWGFEYLDDAAGCCWAQAARPHGTSRSSGVGSH